MSQPPINIIPQSLDYVKDFVTHKFCNPNAPLNLEKEENVEGKVTIVTGSNTGIGFETAFQMARRNAKVIMACRDLEKAEAAKQKIKEALPNADVEVMQLDLSTLASVRKFVDDFSSKYEKLDILINNAGVFNSDGKRHETPDGFELHMGVNHLSQFLLTILLLPKLRKSDLARAICVSSSNLVLSDALDLEDLMMTKNFTGGADGFTPYNRSKRAYSLCVKILAKQLRERKEPVKIFLVCPGLVETEIFRHDRGFMKMFRKAAVTFVGVNPVKGAETPVFCAVDKSLSKEETGEGEMYRLGKLHQMANKFLQVDDPVALKLFEVSKELIGVTEF